MEKKFLRREWIAAALAGAKSKIFGEYFITISELQQFSEFVQREFEKRKLDITIYGLIDNEDFVIKDGIIIVPESWDICMLSNNYKSILSDENLLINFFAELKNKKVDEDCIDTEYLAQLCEQGEQNIDAAKRGKRLNLNRKNAK